MTGGGEVSGAEFGDASIYGTAALKSTGVSTKTLREKPPDGFTAVHPDWQHKQYQRGLDEI
jgi:hypothetical protein